MASSQGLWDWESPLARYKGETYRANTALVDYVSMGPGRSLVKLIRGYRGEIEPEETLYIMFSQYRSQSGSGPESLPPTKRQGTVSVWSMRYQWQARIARLAALDTDRRDEVRDARRKEDFAERVVQRPALVVGVDIKVFEHRV